MSKGEQRTTTVGEYVCKCYDGDEDEVHINDLQPINQSTATAPHSIR